MSEHLFANTAIMLPQRRSNLVTQHQANVGKSIRQ